MPMVLLTSATHRLLRKIVFKNSEKTVRTPSNDQIIYEGLVLLAEKEKVK